MLTADNEPVAEIEGVVAGKLTVPLTWRALVPLRKYQFPDVPMGLIRNFMIWPPDTFWRDEMFVRARLKELPVPELLVVTNDPAFV